MNEQPSETPEAIKLQRDIIVPICQQAQERVDYLERVINLLIAAGHVYQDRVKQAEELAKP